MFYRRDIATVVVAFLVSICHGSFVPAAPVPRTAGTATCTSLESDPDACYVNWTWDEQPRAAQWIQTFDPAAKLWRMVVETAASRKGTAPDPVPAGNLYRVRTCDDPAVNTTCINSTVVWAPLRPPVEEIPPALVSGDGRIFAISKEHGYTTQLIELNNAAMISSLYKVDMVQMPAMTPPVRRWGASDFQDFDNVLNNVYDIYQQMRLPPPEDSTAAVQAPQATVFGPIEEVPPEKRNEYRAAHLRGRVESDMIVFGPANPKYTVVVWADVGCEHCMKMMRDMDELNKRGVQVRFLAFPLRGPYSTEGRKMADIWCSADPKTALRRALLGESVPAAPCKQDVVLLQYALGKKLGVFGSPTIVTDRGEVLGGYSNVDSLLMSLQAESR